MDNFKKSFIAFLLVASTTAFAYYSPLAPQKVNGCYQISNARELHGFAAIVNGSRQFERDSAACGVLTADIVLDSNTTGHWEPMEDFAGSLDGQGHVISNLSLLSVRGGTSSAFIFSINGGTAENPVVIKNVGWENASITGWSSTSIISTIKSGSHVKMDHVHNSMDIKCEQSSSYAAAFVNSVGVGAYLSISNSYNTGNIVGQSLYQEAPGYLIYLTNGEVELDKVYNTGSIASFFGSVFGHVKIKNSYSLGEGQTSGFVGYVGMGKAEIENSFYVDTLKSKYGGTPASAEEFADGTVAIKLHYNYAYDGLIWGQQVGVDPGPTFSGKIVGAHSATTGIYSVEMVTHDRDTTRYVNEYAKGFGLKLQDPVPKEGFVFGGWYENPDYLGLPLKEIAADVSGDKKLYGKWWPLPKPKAGCYEIGSIEDLFGFAAVVNGAVGAEKDSAACGKLVADIVFENSEDLWVNDFLIWTPMWNFAGTFDGNGFAIKNIAIWGSSGFYPEGVESVGLFGSISGGTAEKPVVIKNLTISDGYVLGGWHVGAIAGDIAQSHVVLDSITVDVRVNGDYIVGGLVGLVRSSTVSLTNSRKVLTKWGDMEYDPDVYAPRSVNGYYNVAGLVGTITDSSHVNIVDNYVKGYLEALHCGIASVVGVVDSSDVYISRTYGETDIFGESYVGGLVGGAGGDIRIENSYHVGRLISSVKSFSGAGTVSGVAIGGIIGVGEPDMRAHLVNLYHLGDMTAACGIRSVKGTIGFNHSDAVHLDNVFFSMPATTRIPANGVDSSEFADGSVAYALHNYDNGSLTGAVWGQKVGVDPYPVLSSRVEGYGKNRVFSKLTLHTFDGDTEKYAKHYMEGVVTALPTVYREGHTFYGWFTDPEFLEDSLSYIDATTSGDLEFYAKLEINKYYIKAMISYADGCNAYVEGGGYYPYGSKVVLQLVPDSGCGLRSGYYSVMDERGTYVIDKVTHSDSIPVYIGKAVYKVIYHVDDDVAMPEVSETRTLEDTVTLPTPSKPCYGFDGWYNNEKLEGAPVQGITKGIYGDKEFWPKWKDNSAMCPESSGAVALSSSGSVPNSSSSGVKPGSSSSPKSSSGESPKSSSNSEKKSSSSKTDIAIQVPGMNVAVNVMGRDIQISGAEGKAYALFDMQGHVVQAGVVHSAHVDLRVARAGTYLVRIGRDKRLVSVR